MVVIACKACQIILRSTINAIVKAHEKLINDALLNAFMRKF